MLTISLPDSQATQQLGCLLGKHLPQNSVILLSGNLGAGKTTLVQGIGQGLGIEDAIVSPTFTLINEYLDGRLPLYHLDLYRLEPSQVDSIYPEIYWEGEEVEPGITAIEWWSRLVVLPPVYLEIDLTAADDDVRTARIKAQGLEVGDLKFIESFTQLKEHKAISQSKTKKQKR